MERPWKIKGLWVTLLCQFINNRTARITKIQQLCNLVKGLSCGIIISPAEYLIFPIILYKIKISMAARD